MRGFVLCYPHLTPKYPYFEALDAIYRRSIMALHKLCLTNSTLTNLEAAVGTSFFLADT